MSNRNPRQIRNIALVGFMGTGKSSVGQLVAAQLHFAFLDTDQLIESRVGRSISEIFTQNGEGAFRAMEHDLVVELEGRTSVLISTGGGLPINPDNMASLKKHSLVVCLWASPEKIWERVRHQSHRPLLNDPEPLAKIRSLLAAREPFYRQADVLVNTELRTVKEVGQQIAHQFQIAQGGGA